MKSWQQRERAREILSKEVGYVSKPHGGRLRVALAFPNTYFVGMSNLGFQTVYRPVNEFDIVAFSVSFEWDYTNVITLLRLAGLKPRASDRTHRDPLVVIGGAV